MLYLKSLEIENVRCFGKRQKVNFFQSNNRKISQWTVILGDNGTGKTTLLRSVVSLLPSPQSFLIKRSYDETEYRLRINSEKQTTWDLRHKNGDKASYLCLTVNESQSPFGKRTDYDFELVYKQHYNKQEEGPFSPNSTFDTRLLSPVYCFGYGANRRMGNSNLSGDKFLRPSETLFDENTSLQNSEEYLLQLDYETSKSRKGSGHFKKVRNLLIKVLPRGVKDIRITKTGRLQRAVEVQTPYGWIPINELGLGYKTTIAWLMDFATKMIYYHEKSEAPFEQPAILILDEIDLHMHPEWQRQIITSLTKLFPNTQFIVTAHSPLIAQEALNLNLVLVKRIGDHVQVINDPDVIESWRVDQVLMSDLFGVRQSRPSEFERKIARRIVLIKKKKELTIKEKQELERLNREVHLMPVGETKAEMEAMDILRDFSERLANLKRTK